MIMVWAALAIAATGAITYVEGLMALRRLDAHKRADAVTLGSAEVTRLYGAGLRCSDGYGRDFLNTLYELNGGEGDAPCPDEDEQDEGDLTVAIALQGSADTAVNRDLSLGFSNARVNWEVDETIVRGSRSENIYELVATRDDFIDVVGEVSLVLDYSRSMDDTARGLNNAGAEVDFNKLNRLRRAVNETFFNIATKVNVGAVIFGSVVDPGRLVGLGSVDDAAHQNRIRGTVNGDVFRTADTSGTAYGAALTSAQDQLPVPGLDDIRAIAGRSIIFISDGKPTVPQPDELALQDALNAADQLNVSQIDVFGLFIGQQGEESAMIQVITTANDLPNDAAQPDLSGNGVGDQTDEYFAKDSNANAVQAFFEDLIFDYACYVPAGVVLQDQYPARGTSAWFREVGQLDDPGFPLQQVDNVDDLMDSTTEPPAPLTFKYAVLLVPGTALPAVFISKAGCELLDEETHEFVFRSGYSRLRNPL